MESGKTIDDEYKQVQKEHSDAFKEVQEIEDQLDRARKKYNKISEKLNNLKKEKNLQESKRGIKDLGRNLESEWINKQFSWTNSIKKLLAEVFMLKMFRPKQLAAINIALSKKDMLLVMPTGGGKSLVYQLPAVYNDGFTLVISPLISLIEDQIMALQKLGITACTIHSGTTKDEKKQTYNNIKKVTQMKLLYVTPEWLAKSKTFMAVLKKAYEEDAISLVAIDEVHCCSSWGHDFRPDYRFLGIVRTTLRKVPFIGLTATATTSVLSNIQDMLDMKGCMIITDTFNRPNLYYEVVQKSSMKDPISYIEELLKNKYEDQSGIIYTTTVNDTFKLAKELKERGLRVAPYNAQLEPHQKTRIHEKWLQKKYQAVAATIAFGMGIDKPDVRFVIHYCVPKSMESLYQESGRAGRDGQRADCILMFSLTDYLKVLGMASSLLEENNMSAVLKYCLDSDRCRRAIISKHFEERWETSQCDKMCDHCSQSDQEFAYYDLTQAAKDLQAILTKANEMDTKLTLLKLLDAWCQTGPKKNRILSLTAPKISKHLAEVVVGYLLLNKYLSLDKGFTNFSTIFYFHPGKKISKDVKIEMLSCDNLKKFPKILLEKRQHSVEPLLKKAKKE